MHLLLSLCMMFCSNNPAKAQNFTHSNTEYHISQYAVVDDSRYSSTDPAVNLTMDCLAANGYGQWTASSNLGSYPDVNSNWIFSPNQLGSNTWTSKTNGWFLLGNLISKPSEKYVSADATHPGCQPPGIVSGGKFNTSTYPSTPMATANLAGSVRYVWVASNRQSFIVEGLNDERGPSSGQRQINIALDGLPNPVANRQIIKDPINLYSNASTTTTGGSSHDVATETDPREEFSIACDKNFLYIVWTTNTNVTTAGKPEIWATAISLSSNSPASGYPRVVSRGGDVCSRPTVACDVRYSGSSPAFEVAYINKTTSPTRYSVIVQEYSGITVANSVELARTFKDPFTSGSTHAYTEAHHARILVSSIAGTSTTMKSVYVVADNVSTGIAHDLILYKAITFSTTTPDIATYVDGAYNIGTSRSFPTPMVKANTTQDGVIDSYITALMNPYDNQTGTYNQYHCLYQPAYTVSSTAKSPLILIRGFDNGFTNAGTTDTRIILNQDNSGLLGNPNASYVAAVNQMGIHTHWRIGTTHYYSRDIRNFDEPIEEHTLVTNQCYIADGSSHGGSSTGASLNDGVKMTVWTDPNYGAVNGGSSSSGLYNNDPQNSMFVGSISYSTTGLKLLVGSSDGSEVATLYTMPVCRIAYSGNAGEVNINKGSKWEYYGLRPNWLSLLTVNLNGANTSPHPTSLKIHEGATFYPATVNGDNTQIDILFGDNISPINTASNSSDKTTGLFQIGRTTVTLTDSKVNSFLPTSTYIDEDDGTFGYLDNVVVEIFGFGNGSGYTLNSTRTDYWNTGGGIAKILGTWDEDGPDKIVFDHGTVSSMRMQFDGQNHGGLEIKYLDFYKMDQDEIAITNFRSDYQNILISHNNFKTWAMSDDDNIIFDPDDVIRIKNFNIPSDYGELNITYNQFVTTTNGASTGAEVAIHLINSTGNIEHNTISDPKFYIGIQMESTAEKSFPNTWSYLCGNNISSLTWNGKAIESDRYFGYVKLNEIDNCSTGYKSWSNDHPRLVYSSIKNCLHYGIETMNSTCRVDLAGIHGEDNDNDGHPDNGDDFGGYNSLEGNVNANDGTTPAAVSLETGSFIEYGNNLQTNWTWTDYGKNNTVALSNTDNLLIVTKGGNCSIGNIDNNYWGYNISHLSYVDPGLGNGTNSLWDAGQVTNYTSGIVSYSASTSMTHSMPTTFSGISCSGGFNNKYKKVLPLSVSSYDSCARRYGWIGISPQSPDQFKRQYDTLRLYIETCGKNNDSYGAFSTLDGAVQGYDEFDTTRFDRYRDWLISVLYLNTTQPFYFCACMNSIATTYSHGKYALPNAALAVINYLRSVPACENEALEHTYQQSIKSRHDTWLHTDRSKPEDTTLPSLDQIGLGFLLHNKTEPYTLLPTIYLGAFTSSPNPFKTETTLSFELNRMAYVTVEVFDPLGRKVWGDDHGYSLDKGIHTVHLDGAKLSSGTYYARISTGFGEVKTVKLVKQ